MCQSEPLRRRDASDPQFASPHHYLASADLLEHRYAGHLIESEKAASTALNGEALAITEAGEKGFRERGAGGMCEAMLRVAQALPAGELTRYYWLAQLSAVSGNTARPDLFCS